MSVSGESVAFFGLALAGAGHCAGMCGGFAVIVAARGGRPRRACGHLAAYGLGKTTSYLIVGFAASLGTQSLQRAHLHELRLGLAWLVGGALILAGLRSLAGAHPGRLSTSRSGSRGWSQVLAGNAFVRSIAGAARGVFDSVRALPGLSGSLGIGLTTGLLPCGLSWSAMLFASQSSPASAALGLLAFGLATTPVLAAVGLGALQLPAAWRAPAQRLVAPLLLGLGVWTVVRGVPPGTSVDALRPSCCSEAGVSALVDEVTQQVPLGNHADDLRSIEDR